MRWLLLLTAATLAAQTVDTGPRKFAPMTVGTLPAAASWSGFTFDVTDALTAGSCSVGGGSELARCRSNGSSWASIGGGGGGATGFTATRTSSTVLSISAGIAAIGTVSTSHAAATGTLSGSSASSTVYGYISAAGTPTMGHNGATTLTSAAPFVTATGVTAFPVDSIPLFTATYTSAEWDVSGITRKVPDAGRDILAAGTGISISADGAGVQTITNTATATPVDIGRYPLWGWFGILTNPTSAFTANQTRWMRFTLLSSITVTGAGGPHFQTGLGASKGVRWAVANSAGTILHKTAVQTTCANDSLCQAAFSAPITLSAGVYYLGITTDSTTLTQLQVQYAVFGGALCNLTGLGTAPIMAGFGTAGSGSAGTVDFGASMGTLTSPTCNSGTNNLILQWHEVFFY